MLSCWSKDPLERPSFSDIVCQLQKLCEYPIQANTAQEVGIIYMYIYWNILLLELQLFEKYRENFDVSGEGPSSEVSSGGRENYMSFYTNNIKATRDRPEKTDRIKPRKKFINAIGWTVQSLETRRIPYLLRPCSGVKQLQRLPVKFLSGSPALLSQKWRGEIFFEPLSLKKGVQKIKNLHQCLLKKGSKFHQFLLLGAPLQIFGPSITEARGNVLAKMLWPVTPLFAAIVASRNGIEGSNFYIRNIVIASIKMSSYSIIASYYIPMLTKPCPQRSSCFPTIKHATSTAWDAVDEMGGRCMAWNGTWHGIEMLVHKITSFDFGNTAIKRAIRRRRILW